MSSFRASKVLISLFALELGASQFYIGIMIAMYSLLPALLAVHAGKVSDRLGVRLPMLVGSLGIVAGLLVPGLWPGVPALYVSAALIGVSHMFYNLSAQNLVGSLGGPGEHTKNFSNYALAMSIGSSLGPLAAGFSIDHFGHVTSYLCFAALPLVPVAIMASTRNVGVGPRKKTEEEKAVLVDQPARQPGAARHADRRRGGDHRAGPLPVLHADLLPRRGAVGVRDRRRARHVRHSGLRRAHLAARAREALGARHGVHHVALHFRVLVSAGAALYRCVRAGDGLARARARAWAAPSR